jgi:hypothetical protein
VTTRPMLLCLLLAAGAASAEEKAYVTRAKVEPASFPALAAILHAEMRTGGRFAYVTPEERARIDAALERMARMLAGKRSLADLTEVERVAVFNGQEEVNGILAKRDAERLVCQRRLLPGSHRKETVCETYGDQMARIKGSRENIERNNRRVQVCRELTNPGPVANSGGGGITCQSG